MMPDAPAFPHTIGHRVKSGLTKREYIAAMALQGLLSDVKFFDEKSYEYTAKEALRFADALILQLDNTNS
jgi:hypothetical protein